MPLGRPGLRVISVHVSPALVLLNKPLPGPPLDIVYSSRNASHIAAKMIFGFFGSIEMSIAAVLLSRNSVRFHVLPPSVLLYTPRFSLGALSLPNAATYTMSGLVGSMRIFEMTGESSNPMCTHVLPASVDL